MGGKSDAPDPVDYKQLLSMQSEMNRTATASQTAANRTNSTGPAGSVDWQNNQTFDQKSYDQAQSDYDKNYHAWVTGNGVSPDKNANAPIDGVYYKDPTGNWTTAAPNKSDYMRDNWTQTTTLAPDQQKTFDEQSAGNVTANAKANQLLNNVDTSKLDTAQNFSGLTGDQAPNYDAGVFDKSFGAAMDKYNAYQKPLQATQTQQLQDRLAQSGFNLTDDAAQRSLRSNTLDQNDANLAQISSAMGSADTMATNEASRGNAAKSLQLQIAQALSGAQTNDKQIPVQLAQALRQGTGAIMPNGQTAGSANPGQQTPLDALGAATSSYNQGLSGANAANASQASTTTGAASIVASLVAAYV